MSQCGSPRIFETKTYNKGCESRSSAVHSGVRQFTVILIVTEVEEQNESAEKTSTFLLADGGRVQRDADRGLRLGKRLKPRQYRSGYGQRHKNYVGRGRAHDPAT